MIKSDLSFIQFFPCTLFQKIRVIGVIRELIKNYPLREDLVQNKVED